jgi:hypothetical protein
LLRVALPAPAMSLSAAAFPSVIVLVLNVPWAFAVTPSVFGSATNTDALVGQGTTTNASVGKSTGSFARVGAASASDDGVGSDTNAFD